MEPTPSHHLNTVLQLYRGLSSGVSLLPHLVLCHRLEWPAWLSWLVDKVLQLLACRDYLISEFFG
ncbi:hypothetical protein, partial [Pseudomonas sp. FSL R10-0071]